MLEYPEVVNIVEQLQNEIVGKEITRIAMDNFQGLVKQGFMYLTPKEFEERLIKQIIEKVRSKGKYFYFELKPSNRVVLIDFETSGQILYHKYTSTLPEKYTVKLVFNDNSMLTVRIIAWGFFKVETQEHYDGHKYLSNPGIEPLDDKLDFNKFNELLNHHDKSSKTFFVGQKYICGIGNGYLQDIFFKAKIHPKRKVPDLTEIEREALFTSMKAIMKEAIKKKGRDTEIDIYDKQGDYKTLLGKDTKDKPCPNCGTAITKLSVDGSSAYICTNCQSL